MPEFDKLSKRILELIAISKNIIIASHENPDGDSLGSSLALYHYLSAKGKNVSVFVPNSIAPTYNFLPGIENIHVYSSNSFCSLQNADLFIIVDVNTYARMGLVGDFISQRNTPKILIDHHLNPIIEPDVALVNTDASATCELIYRLINSDLSFTINKQIATALYTGILTDTGGFKHDSTTPNSHIISAMLMKTGINVNEIYAKIFCQIPHNIYQLIGRAFQSSHLYCDKRLNIMYLTEQDLQEFNASPEELNNIAEMTLDVKGVQAGVFIYRHTSFDYYKMSFRSRGNINIRSVAEQYGGGGHFNAAGGKEYKLSLQELIYDIILKIEPLFIEF